MSDAQKQADDESDREAPAKQPGADKKSPPSGTYPHHGSIPATLWVAMLSLVAGLLAVHFAGETIVWIHLSNFESFTRTALKWMPEAKVAMLISNQIVALVVALGVLIAVVGAGMRATAHNRDDKKDLDYLGKMFAFGGGLFSITGAVASLEATVVRVIPYIVLLLLIILLVFTGVISLMQYLGRYLGQCWQRWRAKKSAQSSTTPHSG